MAKRKLELHKETLLSLTDADLSEVSGGAQTTSCPKTTQLLTTTQTPMCPSGATWFASCDYDDQ